MEQEIHITLNHQPSLNKDTAKQLCDVSDIGDTFFILSLFTVYYQFSLWNSMWHMFMGFDDVSVPWLMTFITNTSRCWIWLTCGHVNNKIWLRSVGPFEIELCWCSAPGMCRNVLDVNTYCVTITKVQCQQIFRGYVISRFATLDTLETLDNLDVFSVNLKTYFYDEIFCL